MPPGAGVLITRWWPPETMMSRAAGARGDVWSLGCVIWEAVTLGATPYPGVRARDVMTRVTRGLRAPHPAGASDTLYQLMLSCWMLDPDERPVGGTLDTRYISVIRP